MFYSEKNSFINFFQKRFQFWDMSYVSYSSFYFLFFVNLKIRILLFFILSFYFHYHVMFMTFSSCSSMPYSTNNKKFSIFWIKTRPWGIEKKLVKLIVTSYFYYPSLKNEKKIISFKIQFNLLSCYVCIWYIFIFVAGTFIIQLKCTYFY